MVRKIRHKILVLTNKNPLDTQLKRMGYYRGYTGNEWAIRNKGKSLYRYHKKMFNLK